MSFFAGLFLEDLGDIDVTQEEGGDWLELMTASLYKTVAWVGSKWGVDEPDKGSSGETEPGENRPGEDNSGGYDQGNDDLWGGEEASEEGSPISRFGSSCSCDKELSNLEGGCKEWTLREDGIVVTTFWLWFEVARTERSDESPWDICTEGEAARYLDFETEDDPDWLGDFSAAIEADLQVAFEIDEEIGWKVGQFENAVRNEKRIALLIKWEKGCCISCCCLGG